MNLFYAILVLFIYFHEDITKLRKLHSRKYNERIHKLAERKKEQLYRECLIRELYFLGFEENIQLREDVTSIFKSRYKYGEYFRLGDDGSVSSRCTTVDLDEIKKCQQYVNDLIKIWHNGHIIRSDTLCKCRILAQCEDIVLIGKECYDTSFVFTIWHFDGKIFYNGQRVEGDYFTAKEAFAAEILLCGATLSVEEKEKLTTKTKSLYSEGNPLIETHQIKDIIPPKWSAYVESAFFLYKALQKVNQIILKGVGKRHERK
jgi:hypothetical protein